MASPASSSLNKIERAHQMYRDGQHEEALEFYTEALSMAKSKSQKIALHSNRAACFLKLHDFKKAADECTLVLELDQRHTGALMLRAQTLVTLREYHSALFDVNRLMELNPSSDVYHNLHSRLKTQLSLAPIPESEEEIMMAEMEDPDDLEEGGEKEDQVEYEEEEEAEKKEKGAQVEEPEEEKEKLTDEGTPTDENSTEIVSSLVVPATQVSKDLNTPHSQGWQAIPKPKGHSNLDYSRWDSVEDDSSDDDDDDDSDEDDDEEESQPQYRFRLKTVGVRPVK